MSAHVYSFHFLAELLAPVDENALAEQLDQIHRVGLAKYDRRLKRQGLVLTFDEPIRGREDWAALCAAARAADALSDETPDLKSTYSNVLQTFNSSLDHDKIAGEFDRAVRKLIGRRP